MITIDLMKSLWPHGDQHISGLLEGIVSSALNAFSKESRFDNPLVLAHFFGQCSLECGAGLEMIENLNYSADGLRRTWPTRFGTALAQQYAHNPRIIADYVYSGRMGNAAPPSTDGWMFRGRGLTQLTGRENYAAIGKALGMELCEDPDLCLDPNHTLQIAAADFAACKYEGKSCVEYAEVDDILGVTRALNGGLIGLADRRTWTARWKKALGC